MRFVYMEGHNKMFGQLLVAFDILKKNMKENKNVVFEEFLW